MFSILQHHHFKSLKLYSPRFICVPYLFNKFPFVGHSGCSLIVIPFWVYLDGQISQLDQNVFLLYKIFFFFFLAVVSGSSSSSKYDPEILKAEIATAKSRVGPLCLYY